MESVEGQGSTFRLALPLAGRRRPQRRDAPGGRADGRSAARSSSSTTSSRTATRSASRSSARGSASRWRPTAPRRSSGSTPCRPALVLLDVMLPRMSGIDVCRELRAALAGADHHGHRAQRRDRRRRRASRSAPTTTSPSRSACASWWRGCGPRCGAGAGDDAGSRSTARCSRSATCASTPPATRCAVRGERVALPLKEFELLELLLAERRPGAHPRRADRPGVGAELLRRHQDPRRARQAAAGQDRGRPRAPRRAS